MSTIHILLRTSEYRGDHSADICQAVELSPDETIEQLVSRCNPAANDSIEIRVSAILKPPESMK